MFAGLVLYANVGLGLPMAWYCAYLEEEEESVFNRKYMVLETSIKTKYGRWPRGHQFDSSVYLGNPAISLDRQIKHTLKSYSQEDVH